MYVIGVVAASFKDLLLTGFGGKVVLPINHWSLG